MSGISSGTGLFSGIDSAKIIEQLISIESRPKQYAQRRVQQLQIQQAAFLDLNSKLQAIKTSAQDMRLKKIFQGSAATSSNSDVLTASASNGAPPGTYQFIVDRLVSSQQLLTRGFGDKDTSALNATSFTFESAKARLDRDVSLSDFNGGDGVARGKITITDSTNTTVTVDLSKASSVNEVLDAINNNGTAKVTASVKDGKFIIKDNAGGTVTVANAVGSQTATSLGIAGTATGTLTGSTVYQLSANTTLHSLNDGNGVSIKSAIGGAPSMKVTIGPTVVNINLGDTYDNTGGKQTLKEGAVSTVGGVLKRMNEAFAAAGQSTVSAKVSADGSRIEIVDSAGGTDIKVEETNDTTAHDLGLLGTTNTGTITGKRILAGLNSTLASSIGGGKGIQGDGKLSFTTHAGATFSVDLDALGVRDGSLSDIASAIETASGSLGSGAPRVSVRVNDKGTGLLVTDNTTGTGKLIIGGPTDNATATSLGIATVAGGVDAAKVVGTNLQHKYLGRSSLVSGLNNGKGIGTGKFTIIDAKGIKATVDIGDDSKTLGDVIDEINSRGIAVKAEINANGDGIVIRENIPTGQSAGANKIKITDDSGAVAKGLNIAGEAKATGAGNLIDGSYEKTVTFAATDSLQKVTDAINAAGVGVSAAIIRDGSGSTPFRLGLTSQSTGTAGQFLVDTGTLDLGITSLDAGNDARVFYGSTDPAKAILMTSSSNTLDSVISGVKIDLKSISDKPVTLSIGRDTDGIFSAVNLFISSFNTAIDRIDKQTSYNADTKVGGPLLGDSTAQQLRSALFNVVQGRAQGITGRYDRLADIGLKVGDGGTISLDETRLRAAIAEDPAAVEQLFTGYAIDDTKTTDLGNGVTVSGGNTKTTYKTLGVIAQMEVLTDKYLNSVDGVLSNQKKSLDNQIAGQNKRIDAFDLRLADKRAVLERQFAAMESAIAKMQSQQGALQSLG